MKTTRNGNNMPNSAEIDAAFDQYATAAGRVLYSWNLLHETLGQLFYAVIGGNQAQIMAVWYSIKNDRNQREMLKVAVAEKKEADWPQKPDRTPIYKYSDEIKWLLKSADELAKKRDDAIHAPASLRLDYTKEPSAEMEPWVAYGHPRAKNLRGKKLLEEFDYYENRAHTLIEYCVAITYALNFPETNGIPEKPLLPTRGQKKNHLNRPRR